MSINLQKGQKIDLTKGGTGAVGGAGPNLRRVMVGLGWDENKAPVETNNGGFFKNLFKSDPPTFDCDASAILCGANGKAISNDLWKCTVFYGRLQDDSGAIVHQGDNLTGAGEGDDEQIMVDLSRVPMNIEKIVFTVNIYDARPKNQHFGMINNAFIRLVNMDNNTEICRFNLSENYNNMTGLIVGEIYRKNGDWKFNAIGQPVQEASRISELVKLFV